MTEEEFNSTSFHKGMTARLINNCKIYYIISVDFNDNYIGLHEDQSFDSHGDSSGYLNWVSPEDIESVWRDE